MSDLETMPGHLIRRLQQISVARFTSRMTEAGLDLTSVQYAAMLTLRDHPGLDQQTLAGMIAYDRVTIGGVIDRLVQKGLVEREVSPTDRRARVLMLSRQGGEALAAATPWVDQVQDDIVSHLTSEEQDIFLKLLKKTTRAGNELSRAPLRPAPTGAGNRSE
ncbi:MULTISPECIES: MarR family winged helix-turn-helix transcriptional regulator [Novosphingobium]|uniref:MarR family winged helix-turn-helix transcriptional regulator n=1 Tax=Novosphingobium sp. RL4 TaxID=3109595 RepID=UPI002D7723D2|nr:MarR family winged helix-turn-helix transcriptional regulator [Novosphingobium sp. RL4]WRT95517.1 MarR family winged helix-turn-helix transcriptional regulator [Novosphingobium sp. RL4]